MKTLLPAFILLLATLALTVPYGTHAQDLTAASFIPLTDGDELSGGLQYSPDGQFIVFLAQLNDDTQAALYSMPTTGGTPVRISLDVTDTPPTSRFAISPDSSRVAFIQSQRFSSGLERVFSVPITGPTNANPITLLSTGSGLAGTALVFGLEFTPDSQRVIFTRQTSNANAAAQLFNLFSNRATGGDLIQLNENINRSTSGSMSIDFLISSDSQYVVYYVPGNEGLVSPLYKSPVDASSAVRITTNAQSQGDLTRRETEFLITPDGSRVIFSADTNNDGVYRLYSKLLAGNAPTVSLNNFATTSFRSPYALAVSPDSSRLVYSGPTSGTVNGSDSARNLFSVPVGGGTITQISNLTTLSPIELSPFDLPGDFYWPQTFTRDGNHVVYSSGGSTQIVFVSSIINGSDRTISVPPASNGSRIIELDQFSVINGERVSYRAFGRDLYSARLSGGGLVKLSNTQSTNQEAEIVAVNDNGDSVFYKVEDKLFVSAIDQTESFAVNSRTGQTNISRVFSVGANIIDNALFFLGQITVGGDLSFIVFRLDLPNFISNDDFCFPIKSANGNIAVVCL